MTAASAKISVGNTAARYWRENLPAGARFVAIDKDGLTKVEVDSSEPTSVHVRLVVDVIERHRLMMTTKVISGPTTAARPSSDHDA